MSKLVIFGEKKMMSLVWLETTQTLYMDWIGLADSPFQLLAKIVKIVTSIFQHSNPSFPLLYFKWQKEYSPLTEGNTHAKSLRKYS